MVSTYDIDDVSSIDANLQLNLYTETLVTGEETLFSFSADYGYYVMEKQLQWIIATNFMSVSSSIADAHVFTLVPGITIETGDSYIIVLNGSFDITGKNIEKSTGFGMALTLTFD